MVVITLPFIYVIHIQTRSNCISATFSHSTWQAADGVVFTLQAQSDLSQTLHSQHALQQVVDAVQAVAMETEVLQFVFSPMKVE